MKAKSYYKIQLEQKAKVNPKPQKDKYFVHILYIVYLLTYWMKEVFMFFIDFGQ